MQRKLLTATLTSLLLLSSLQANESIEDDLGGFDIEEVTTESNDDLAGFCEDEESDALDGFTEEVEEDSKLSLSGNIAFKTAYGYKNHAVDNASYQGFNQAQTALYLQADYKFNSKWKMRLSGDTFYDAIYDLRDEPYNDDVLDAYRTQLRLDDTYIQGQITHDIDIKIGRQIVVWGKSDSIRVTDVINPLDNRNPGMTDIEDLRLPTTMAKLDYYIGQWNLSAMIIGESRIFLEAAPYGEYFPVNLLFPTAPAQGEFFELKQPSTSWDNTQYAFAANGVFSGWDLSFYGADVFDSKWHLEGTTIENAARVVNKIKMLGSAANIATGSWLIKGEIAYMNGIRYNSTLDAKNRVDTLIGVDYMGISDSVLSAEFTNRHIFDYEAQMGSLTTQRPDYIDQDEYQTALRATRSFMNDSLDATILLSMFGASWEYGGFARIWVEYEVMNAVNANFGVVDYLKGDRPFAEAIENNDKIFADITYSF